MRPLLLRIAFALTLLLVVQELLARAVFPLPEVLNFDRAAYSHLGFAPGGHQPTSLGHASFTWASDPDGFEFVHALNLYGFRDETWPLTKRAGSIRVAFVGDSFVEGFSAPPEDTIPRVFGERARAAGETVETLNLGVGGGSLPSYARLLRDALPLFRPDAVVLVLFANDVVEKRLADDWLAGTLVPERTRAWMPRLVRVGRRLAAGERAPRRWTEPPFAFLPAVPDPRNPWSDGRRAGALAYVEPEIARAARNGRFNPMLPEAMPWFAKALPRPVDLAPWLRAFRDYTQTQGAALGVVYLPSKMQVSNRYLPAIARYSPPGSAVSLLGPEYQRHARELAETCAQLDLPFLDLTPALRERDAEAASYWSYDDHMLPAGYREAAARIHDWWQLGWADQRPGEPR
jgi:hypothetical protein